MTQCWLGIAIKAQLQWFFFLLLLFSKPWTFFINRSQKSVEYKTFSVKDGGVKYSFFFSFWKPQQLLWEALIKWELSQPRSLIETYGVGSHSEHLGKWEQKGFRLRQQTPGGPGVQMRYFAVWQQGLSYLFISQKARNSFQWPGSMALAGVLLHRLHQWFRCEAASGPKGSTSVRLWKGRVI